MSNNGNGVALHPYLTFDGNCREAMTFYRDVIGGEMETHTFADMPEEVPDEMKNRIMHASIRSGSFSLMASDSMPGHSPALVNGNTVTLSVSTKGLNEAGEIFRKLSDGGNVTMQFEPVFWGGNFGMLVDRFGMNWMVSSEEQSEKVETATSEVSE